MKNRKGFWAAIFILVVMLAPVHAGENATGRDSLRFLTVQQVYALQDNGDNLPEESPQPPDDEQGGWQQDYAQQVNSGGQASESPQPVDAGQDNGGQRDSGGKQEGRPRKIYIGDLITIEVASQTVSREEIEERFRDFEIVDIKETGKGFLVTVRSFVPGEKIVNLGGKEIVITISSALADIEREDVFEGDTSPQGAGFGLDWKYPFFALLALFLATGVMFLRKYLLKRRKLKLSPYERFTGRCVSLRFDDRDYFPKLTLYFKEYVESVYNISIKGKTTREITDSISVLPGLAEVLPHIENWLKECDYYKFTGVAASDERKRILLDDLVETVDKIEKVNRSQEAKKGKADMKNEVKRAVRMKTGDKTADKAEKADKIGSADKVGRAGNIDRADKTDTADRIGRDGEGQ